MRKTAKQVVPVRLSIEQRQAIKTRVEGSSLLDESKFIRLAIDWLLQFNVSDVLAARMIVERQRAKARLMRVLREGGAQ